MTANWVMQLATSPRLVAVALETGSVTRELVEKNGGRIFVHSRGPDAISSDDLPAGTTTRFRVELPLATL